MLGDFAACRAIPGSSSLQTKLKPLRMREYFPFMALDSFFSFVVTEGGAAWVYSFGIGERDLIIITFSREIKPMGELKTQTCRSLEGDHI